MSGNWFSPRWFAPRWMLVVLYVAYVCCRTVVPCGIRRIVFKGFSEFVTAIGRVCNTLPVHQTGSGTTDVAQSSVPRPRL